MASGAESTVQLPPDGTGKRLRTFENTIGPNLTETEAVALTSSTGALIAESPLAKDVSTSTGTPTAFVPAVASAVVLAANPAREGATIYNNHATGNLYVQFGAVATTAAGGFVIKIAAGGYYEIPFRYKGIVTGIWDVSSGNSASVLELSA